MTHLVIAAAGFSWWPPRAETVVTGERHADEKYSW